MPPVVIAAGIGAVGALGGAAMQSRSANKATKAQSDATAQALQFERQREAQRQQNYQTAMADYRRQWDAWNAGRTALLQRYGMNVQMPTMAQPAQTPAPQAGQPVPQRPGLADLMRSKQEMAPVSQNRYV